MKKYWLLFYIRLDKQINIQVWYSKVNLNIHIKDHKNKWSHYEIKEVEFELPKERWIVSFQSKETRSIYYRGPFESKEIAQSWWNNCSEPHARLVNIFKEPLPTDN